MPYSVYHTIAKKSILLAIGLFWFLPAAAHALTPSDPSVAQWSYADTQVFDAWELATGSRDVVVAVIDNGFDTFHPELAQNIWKNIGEIPDNGIDDDANGYADDVWGWNFVGVDADGNGGLDEEELKGSNDPRPDVTGATADDIEEGSLHHGTLVAGIIGARGDNHAYGAGINWYVRLMNLKVVGNSGNIGVARIAEAVRYAADNGADIINISLVGPADQPDLKDAIRYAHSKGVAVVAAAGNDYQAFEEYPKYPICADSGEGEQWVLGVSAITEDHRLAQFSNRGNCVDIAAPGVHISSTMRYAPRYGLDAFYGGPFSGTSFAAPFVSGAVALLKSIHPEWGPEELFDTLLQTVHKTPPWDEAEYTRYFGAGLVQIADAVRMAASQAAGAHALAGVLAYAPNTGVTHMETIAGGSSSASGMPPKGAKALAAYKDSGNERHAGVFPKGWFKNELVIFDSAWHRLAGWTIPYSGAVSLAVGDVAGDERPEFIISPRGVSRQAFAVYDAAGSSVHTRTLSAPHRGSFVGLVNAKGGTREILAVYAEGGTVRLHRFDRSFALTQTLDIPYAKRAGQVAAGDIDKDGLQEYVIGSGAGEDARLTYMDEDGVWKRTFAAYAPGVQNGLAIAVGDYDRDGKDDVVVGTETGGNPIRVWTDTSKQLAEWLPFDRAFKGTTLLVPEYRR
jgi:subtilisin family serine protease